MAKDSRRVVVVTAAAAFENPGRSADNGISYVESLGATVTAAMILNRSDADEPAHLGQLESADVVYLTGGNPAHLLRSLLGSKAADVITEVFQADGLIIGSSAGAMVLGQVMRGDVGGSWIPALGFVPGVAVRPHHSPDSETNSRSIRRGLDSNVSILGIPTATACISEGGTTLQVLGASSVTVYSSDGVSRYSLGDWITLENPGL